MKYEDICQIEPRIERLRARIPTIMATTTNYWRGWFAIKKAFSKMVGWNAKDERLSSSECYDSVYHRMINEADAACAQCHRVIEIGEEIVRLPALDSRAKDRN